MSTKHTEGPWFVSGVRFRMNGGEWHSINRYDEDTKSDENIACVGFDPRTGEGLADARLIAAAPEMLAALKAFLVEFDDTYDGEPLTMEMSKFIDMARAAVAKAEA